jgi:hypothetical protein
MTTRRASSRRKAFDPCGGSFWFAGAVSTSRANSSPASRWAVPLVPIFTFLENAADGLGAVVLVTMPGWP